MIRSLTFMDGTSGQGPMLEIMRGQYDLEAGYRMTLDDLARYEEGVRPTADSMTEAFLLHEDEIEGDREARFAVEANQPPFEGKGGERGGGQG